MQIKNWILILLVVLLSFPMAAQQVIVRGDTTYSYAGGRGGRFGVAKDTLFWIINRPRDNWFFSPRVGMQTYFGNSAYIKNCINMPTPMVQFSFGKWFIPDVSFELSGSYSPAVSQSRYSLNPYVDYTGVGTVVDNGTTYYEYQSFTFNQTFLDGALTLDFTNFFKGYYKGNLSRYHFLGTVGLGLGFGWGKVVNPRSYSADRTIAHNSELLAFLALNSKYKMSEHFDFNLILRFTGIRGSFDDYYGVDDHVSSGNYRSRYDFIPSLCAGITLNVGRKNVLHKFIETRHQDILVNDMHKDTTSYNRDSSLLRIVKHAMDAVRNRDSIITALQEQQANQPVAYYILYYPNGFEDDSLIVNPHYTQSYMKHFPQGDTLGEGDSVINRLFPGMPYIMYYGADTINKKHRADTYFPSAYNQDSLKERLDENKSIIYCFIDKDQKDSLVLGNLDEGQPYMIYYPKGKHGSSSGEGDGKPNIVFYPNGTPNGIDSVTGKPLGGQQFVTYCPVEVPDSVAQSASASNKEDKNGTSVSDLNYNDDLDESDVQGKSVPELVLSEIEKRNLKAVYVTFELNKAEVYGWEKDKLREMAEYINADTSGKQYVVMGAADSRTGTPAINQRLSDLRCNAVYNILVNEYKVNPKRLIKRALGGIDDYEPYIMNRLCIVVVNDPKWKYLIDLKLKLKQKQK